LEPLSLIGRLHFEAHCDYVAGGGEFFNLSEDEE
jgi:hypothetical protein